MAKSKNEINMTLGAMLPKIIRFAIPLIFSSILQILFHTADVIVAGRFAGETSLAAVGACSSIINLIVTLFIGLSLGATIVVSKYYGEKDYAGMQKATHTAILMSIICGLFLTVLGNVVAKPVLHMLGVPDDVIGLATSYMKIYFLGAPFNILYNFASGIMRSYGDTKSPLRFITVAGIVNVILNLVFVIYFKMAASGVALATVISHALSAIFATKALMHINNGCHLDLKQLRIHKQQLFMIIKAGVPAGLQSILFSISNVLVSSSVNSFGTMVVAGNSAAMSIGNFVYTSMHATSQSAVTVASQNYGAKEFKRILKGWGICAICVSVVGILTSAAAVIFADTLLSIYSTNPQVIECGKIRINYLVATYTLCGFMEVSVACLRGIGHAVLPMVVSIFGVCVFRVFWIYTIFAAYRSLPCLYISYPISWVLTGVVQTVLFFMCLRKKEMLYNKSLEENAIGE